MGSKNPGRDKKKAPAPAKQAKPAEKPKPEAPKPPKKPAAEAKDRAQVGRKRPAQEPERVAPPYQPETSELEKKRLQVAEELRKVEQQASFKSLGAPAAPPTAAAPHTHWSLALQIVDLETKYLDQSSAYGNAVRGKFDLNACGCVWPPLTLRPPPLLAGYEGFLGGLSQANRKGGIKPEERLFSMSSCSSVLH